LGTDRPYRINGIPCNREDLGALCRRKALEPGVPDWERKVYAFIYQFQTTGSGPILQRTSGTTGDPREYKLDRGAMVASALKTLDYFGLQPGDRALLCLPVDYVAGKMMVVRALVGGLDLHLREPSGRPLEEVTGSFDFAAMVPLQVQGSLEAGDGLSSVRTLLVGGGELHPSLRTRIEGMETPAVFESFAMTETCTHFALRRINGAAPDPDFRLLEGVEVRTDERGCLVVNVPGVTNGSVVSNDLVEIGKDGLGFTWLGRFDHVIKTGGIKVIPEVLEKRIKDLLGPECLLLSLPDEKLGQRLVLLAEYSGPGAPVQEWADLLREKLAPHELPRQILTTDEIPRNASLKPDRIAARKLI
jgi:O-succinylbenzoic acid--CoA ligase